MIIQFNIHYFTEWGEEILLMGNQDILGNWNEDDALTMSYQGEGKWVTQIQVSPETPTISYSYLLKKKNGEIVSEWGNARAICTDNPEVKNIICHDHWFMPSPEEKAFFSSAFTQVIFPKSPQDVDLKYMGSQDSANENIFIFRVYAPCVPKGCVVGLIGNHREAGEWNKPFALLSCNGASLWEYKGSLSDPSSLEYKYVIYHLDKQEIISWEGFDNRRLPQELHSHSSDIIYIHDGIFKTRDFWRGAGVSVPVFSLRSQKGMGIGEFSDLIPLIDWADQVGLRMVQILPINDTTATYTWRDSYPYAAISVYALHPAYASLDQMNHYHYLKLEEKFAKIREELNALMEIDYDEVMRVKMKFFRELYTAVKQTLDNDPDFQDFCTQNEEWLKDYAVFSFLRDTYQTANFVEWKEHSIYDAETIAEFLKPGSTNYEEVRLYYFIQFHLHMQMKFVSNYARSRGIVLKGDIPIGIYRHSADAWAAPHLFNMDSQAGAPPDYFSRSGQNWGFPTYNWEQMAKDGYSWWRKRLSKMADYFDAYRIDHVLGFFRIWEIPYELIEGSLGYFNPSLPFTVDELRHRGLPFEHGRFCLPYIRGHVLDEIIPYEIRNWVEQTFLIEDEPGYYRFRPEFYSQREIKSTLETSSLTDEQRSVLRQKLFALVGEVLFIKDPKVPYEAYHPRFALHFTRSYHELDDYAKSILNELYNDYFYHRHENFWRDQGMIKLPAIVAATDMLVCAEDLGMVPKCVPSVLYDLGILSLEIQRMPKLATDDFVYKDQVPYLSVYSPSSHDIAPLRAWWEQHRPDAQKLYNNVLGKWGEAPYFCEPWIVEEIVRHHLEAPSMWTVIPIQDLLGMSMNLRRENPSEEQINDPSNSQHYWRYRMHIDIETIINTSEFNDLLTSMIQNSHRDTLR